MDPRSVTNDFQDEDLVRNRIERLTQMKGERGNWEKTWRDVERRVDPVAAGGFDKLAPGGVRGSDIYDSTAILGIDRYEAAIGSIVVPRKQIWHTLTTDNDDLNKRADIQRWCEYATKRLFALRYEPHANFESQFYMDLRSGGTYGTSSLIVDERVGGGLYYRAMHVSEVYIDEDHAGFVDTVYREHELTLRQIVQKFGLVALSDRMRMAWDDPRKHGEKWRLAVAVQPNETYDPERWDYAGKPIESTTISLDDKWIMKRAGYHTMPMPTSRVTTSPGDKWGRSPAMKVLGVIKGVNEMAKTMLRAAHKAVDPALAFHDDGLINKLSTRPGGLNPGMVDERGQLLVRPIEMGGNMPIGRDVQEEERKTIRSAFLEEVFSIVFERRDRMTATEVMEIAAKTGVLVAPTSARIETEKLDPMVTRELDIGMRSGRIAPPPPVFFEAGAKVRTGYLNPMSRMARMESVSGFTQWTGMLVQAAAVDQTVLDIVDFEAAGRGSAEILGVPPSWVATPEDVAAKRQARAAAKQQQDIVQGLEPAGNAALAFSKAAEIANKGVL